jgi:hypothetical protein
MRSPRGHSFLSHGRKKRIKERPPAASPKLKIARFSLKRPNALRLNEAVSSRENHPIFFTLLRRGRDFVRRVLWRVDFWYAVSTWVIMPCQHGPLWRVDVGRCAVPIFGYGLLDSSPLSTFNS